MSQPTVHAQAMELLDERKEAMDSETYRLLCTKLKEMDQIHTPLYEVEWATMDATTGDKKKVQTRRRTSICRLVKNRDEVTALCAYYDAMGVTLTTNSVTWFKWLYHAMILPEMVVAMERYGNLIQASDNSATLVIFSCSPYNPYTTLMRPGKRAKTREAAQAREAGQA